MLLVIVWILVFLISLAVLLKASDYFTDSAEKIGLLFGLSPFIIGVTIVAFGTSLPELVSSIVAVLSSSSEIVIGNVVGSNIANIFLVLGVVALIHKQIDIKHKTLQTDAIILMLSAVLLTVLIFDKTFSLLDAIISIIGIVAYIIYSVRSTKQSKPIPIDSKKLKELKSTAKEIKQKKEIWKMILVLILSGVFIYLGATVTVKSIIKLSELMHIGSEIIAVSAVALGTSLPELAVSLTAAKKGNAEIAVGNVLGSNIFNSLAVMGFPALFGALTIPSNILFVGIPTMLLASVLFYFITRDKKVTRIEGFILFSLYILFIGKLFGLF